jgi:hypothetical protein
MNAARYLIKSAILGESELDVLSKKIPAYRRKKVRKDEEGFRQQLRQALQGYKLDPDDARALANRRHGTQAAGWLLGPAAVTTQVDRQERLRQMILREIMNQD